MRTEEKRQEKKTEKKTEKKKERKNNKKKVKQIPIELAIIQLLFFIALLNCDKSVNDSKHGNIESQTEVIGIWKPLKADLYRKGMNSVDSTIDYSRHDYFYEFTKDSFHYIEPANDTACYQRTAVLSSINNGILTFEGLEQKIDKVNDTLAITWTTDSIFDAIVYSIELNENLGMDFCPKNRQDTATSIDDLPTHRKP